MKKIFLKKIITTAIISTIISTMYPVAASATWIKDSQNKWNWTENGEKAIGWNLIDGKWYYFSNDGIMSIGWIRYSNKWYNLSLNGAMNTGWIKNSDGNWYNLSQSGEMNIGWINEDGTWYFTNSSGAMQTGVVEIDGKSYIFSESGSLLKDQEQVIQKLESSDDNDKEGKTRVGYVATDSNPLNVRSQASLSSDIIGTLSKGTKIILIDEENNGFWHISANGLDGWASSTWISFEKPVDNQENVISDSDNNLNSDTDTNTNSNSSNAQIRTTAPDTDNKCYYSDANVFYQVKLSPPFLSKGSKIQGNCTWYAWGRAWEMIGYKPTAAGLIGNACSWWEENKESGKYKYGSTPKVGAIAVWKSSMPNSGGHGHVAIVEKIENGKTYISESMWQTVLFKYREIYGTQDLYGYIYLDEPNY
ncbi:CHAP domain-containing protein [Clostridium uliginosum]|uniref:N-acetylmuramoyl-L-alanine amidase n=1 Tax=Clostridium uliginosum TaxID=119641 RepID=A0A1I1PDK8_9CLOT|nr:CHAP domain-containing protein [Clostridium uliginosum]SFD05698.1 Putative cell wall binding repeat-containing protein [Clostridium uliginosum]